MLPLAAGKFYFLLSVWLPVIDLNVFFPLQLRGQGKKQNLPNPHSGRMRWVRLCHKMETYSLYNQSIVVH